MEGTISQMDKSRNGHLRCVKYKPPSYLLYSSVSPVMVSVLIFFSPSHVQGSEEMKLKPQHISTLVVSLADFVRMADRKIIANTLSQLKLELDFDSTAISQLQVVLFGFQDAVSVTRSGATSRYRTR